MAPADLGQAIWEYVNDPIISEMIELYGGVEGAAAGAIECFVDSAFESEAVQYIQALGNNAMTTAVIAYLERNAIYSPG
jgi:hypothetical protein